MHDPTGRIGHLSILNGIGTRRNSSSRYNAHTMPERDKGQDLHKAALVQIMDESARTCRFAGEIHAFRTAAQISDGVCR